ncbi:hypothetical protein [Flavivirga algicola]|uniref:TonB-dependent receptor plug domain-containing protein n=1 Tax=Flavivirga algicola TaxID=2729136 RepID=A0ABX1S2F0_9FLAO|nr:hypothetical protein [Flavivirga algicola]NMH89088.1 hypothetical protein [Flavivirga algicola]
MINSKKNKFGLVLIVVISLINLKAISQEKQNNIIEKANKTLKLQKKSPLYILNDKIVSKRMIMLIQKESIDSVSIIRPKNAFEKYGEKGRNGVVEVYSKKMLRLIENKHVSEIEKHTLKAFLLKTSSKEEIPNYNKALIIIDNKQRDKTILDSIIMPNVASIAFRTGKEIEVKKKYGKASKNGVILVKTIDRESSLRKYHEFLLKNKSMIFVIDGIPSTFNVAKSLNPLKIQSVNILKGEAATKIYKERGKNGAVLIFLKKPKKN